jgi:DGQHR domain-containing protein
MTLEVKGLEFVQNGKTLFLGKIKISDLLDRTKVDVWHASNQDGYQREVIDSRAKAFGRYIGRTMGISPNNVFLNLRDMKDARFDGDRLIVQDGVTFWIVDGQHRIRGLEYAIASGMSNLKDFEIPVVITIMPSRYEEAKQFAIINKTQKGVRSDLAERFLQKAIKEEGKAGVHRQANEGVLNELLKGYEWKPKALGITDSLNNNGRSVWKNLIRLPNEPKGPTVISQKTFMDSLEPILKDTFFGTKSQDTLVSILENYWHSINETWPEIKDDIQHYVLYKLTGVTAMHKIFLTISGYTTNSEGKKNLTKENLYRILHNMREAGLGIEFWSSDGQAGIYGTNKKGIKLLSEYLEEVLSETNGSMTGDLEL